MKTILTALLLFPSVCFAEEYKSEERFRAVVKQLENKWGVQVAEHDPALNPELAAKSGLYDRMNSTLGLQKGQTGNDRFLTLLHEATHMVTDKKFRRDPTPKRAAPAIQIHSSQSVADHEAFVIHPLLPDLYSRGYQIDEMKTYRKGFEVISQLFEKGIVVGSLSLDETDSMRLLALDLSSRFAKATEAVLQDGEKYVLDGHLKNPGNFLFTPYADNAGPELKILLFEFKTATGATVQIQIPMKVGSEPADQEAYALASIREGLKLARAYFIE